MANSDLPGYAPERPLWQPPAVIPSGSVGELARAVQTALAGISGALQQLGGRRNVVPLQGDLDARDGQVIAGVASGQVITLPSPDLGQFGTVTVIVTAVSSAATVVSPDGSSHELDQTGVYEFAISPDDTAWRAPPWLSSGGAGFDWSTSLDKGASSGAHNPIIDAGQYIGFGDQSLIPPGGTNQIRAATDFGIRSEGNIALTSATTMQLRPLGSWLWCNPFGPFYVYTANTPQLEIGTDGTWYLGASFDAGSSGEVLTSQGAGSPPIWASVDLSSVTYTAGDGIDLASNVFSADVSDFAGTGLEDDGSNNLRIAAAAAGAGLTGGGGSALAVGAGDGITVNANDVAVKVSDIAGAGLADDGSNNLRSLVLVDSGTTDTTSTGTVTTLSPTLNGLINYYRFNSANSVTVRGIAVPTNEGQLLVIHKERGGAGTITLNDEDGSAASASNRIRSGQTGANLALTGNQSVLLGYFLSRWRVLAFSQA